MHYSFVFFRSCEQPPYMPISSQATNRPALTKTRVLIDYYWRHCVTSYDAVRLVVIVIAHFNCYPKYRHPPSTEWSLTILTTITHQNNDGQPPSIGRSPNIPWTHHPQDGHPPTLRQSPTIFRTVSPINSCMLPHSAPLDFQQAENLASSNLLEGATKW